MKKFSRINRGVILTLVVLLCLTVYFVIHGFIRKQDKKELMEITEKYIITEVSYNMLPEKYRSGEETISEEELSAYIQKMQEDIKSYYINNESNYKYIIDDLKTSLEKQAYNEGLVHNYSKSGFEFKSISFNGDTASVNVETLTKIDREQTAENPYMNYLGDATGEQTNTVTDTVNFQKVDGEWKVTFSNLSNGLDYNEFGSAADDLLEMFLGF